MEPGTAVRSFTAAVADGGMGFTAGAAGSIYALFTSLVYLFGLPGGWIADRVIGQRQAVLIGGIVIALGHFTLAAPLVIPGSDYWSFYLGLMFLVIGTGLLKPNVSAIVGDLVQPLLGEGSPRITVWRAGFWPVPAVST